MEEMGVRQVMQSLGWILLLTLIPLVCPLHGFSHLSSPEGKGGMVKMKSLTAERVDAGMGPGGGAQRQGMRLRGGGDMMDDRVAGEEKTVGDGWNMLTDEDMFGVNVTMMQMSRHPYIMVELWWDSMGKFRCTYEDTGEDILCIFPQGAISDKSGWELENLALLLDKERGMHPLPRGTTVLGGWTLEPNERFVRVRNLHQEQNHLFLTEYGFLFADSIGNVIICKDNSKPRKISKEAAGEILGVDTSSWPVLPELTQDEVDLWDAVKGPYQPRDPFEPFPDTSSIEERGAVPTHPDYMVMPDSGDEVGADDASVRSSNAPARASKGGDDASVRSSNAPARASKGGDDASVRSSNAPARASRGAGEDNRATPSKREREE